MKYKKVIGNCVIFLAAAWLVQSVSLIHAVKAFDIKAAGVTCRAQGVPTGLAKKNYLGSILFAHGFVAGVTSSSYRLSDINGSGEENSHTFIWLFNLQGWHPVKELPELSISCGESIHE